MKRNQVQPQKITGKKDFYKPGFVSNPPKIVYKDFEVGKKFSLTIDIINVSYVFNSFHPQPLDDEIIKVKGRNYHKSCYQTKNDILEIRDLFAENINKNVVFSSLMSVINNIIFRRGVTSDYLKFALNYYIQNKIPLNYPQGLYYVVQNKDVKTAYEKSKAESIKKKMLPKVDVGLDIDKTYERKTRTKKTIGDIFNE